MKISAFLNFQKGNLSKNIDPKDCELCGGLCCKSFSMVYPKKRMPLDIEGVISRFRLLDTPLIEVFDHPLHVEVRFNIMCSKFVDGKCSIWDRIDRPYICKIGPVDDDILCPYKKTK